MSPEFLVRRSQKFIAEFRHFNGLIHHRNSFFWQEVFNNILEEISKTIYLRPSEELMYELHKTAVARVVTVPLMEGLGSMSTSEEYACLSVAEDDCPVLGDNGCALEDDSSFPS